MKYITISEAATKFNLSERSVRNYCSQNRIPGAILQGKTWLIPFDAQKPERSNGKENDVDEEDLSLGYELVSFINNSPVSFFAIDNVKRLLTDNGYQELLENKPYDVKPGDKIFFLRNCSSLVALNVGKNVIPVNIAYHVIASHSDSPCLKIKPECDGKSDIYNRLNVEVYGGLIASTWLDRPLGIAGRVIINNEDGLESRLINLEDNLVMIPNLCIHFNRDINSGYNYDRSVDLQAFVGQELEGQPLKDLLAKHLRVEKKDIVNFDLYLYNHEQGYVWGSKKEYVSSSRLDDLECVFTSSKAFVNASNDNAINVLYIADNEEVGSMSRQGADSDFLEGILRNISAKLGGNYQNSIANSFLISADNAHAVHPNKPSISDPNNRPYMNKGIAIKYNAAQSYTSDAISGAIFQRICENVDVPYQFFTNRSDIRGGSTLGDILLSHLSFLSVDVGLPQLAMHSSFETAGTIDIKYAFKAFKEFYSSNIEINGNRYKISK